MSLTIQNQINLFAGKETGATLGFESTLWEIADKLRGHIDVAQYKYLVLGLIFVKSLADLAVPYSGSSSDSGRQNTQWIFPDSELWSSLLVNAGNNRTFAHFFVGY